MKTSFVRKGKTVSASSSSSSEENSSSSNPTSNNSSSAVSSAKEENALPAGTRPSLQNGQLLVSTGLDDLDQILGGGCPIGTLLLLEEDYLTAYYSLLVRYFVAEGIVNDHSLFLLSEPHSSPSQFFSTLPMPSSFGEAGEDMEDDISKNEGLRIAWRYQDSLINKSKSSSKVKVETFSHNFDLSQAMDEKIYSSYLSSSPSPSPAASPSPPCLFSPQSFGSSNPYHELYGRIYQYLKFNDPSGKKSKLIKRIVLTALAEPPFITFPDSETHLITFLHALRGLLRTSTGVCLLSLPTYLLSSSSPSSSSSFLTRSSTPSTLVKKIYHMSDFVISLSSFEGNQGGNVSELFKSSYHGFLTIKKLARLNTINSHLPDTNSFGFVRRRRKLVIEKLHLPPEISRSSHQPSSAPLMCVPGKEKNPLDF